VTTPSGTGRAPGVGAAFFDLDKTVIAKSSTLAFGRSFYQGGLVNRRAVLKSTYAQFVYLQSGADADQMDRMRDGLAKLATGWPVAQVQTIVAEALHELINPLVYEEAVALIQEHQRAGRTVVLVSSSGEEVVAPIGQMLGVDRVIATRMAVADGRYTGKIAFYAYGPHKADAIRELAAQENLDLAECSAYSDSMTDLPMLEAVGHPTAVNPDRGLRRLAVERGWPVLDFAKPVRLRDRMPNLATPRPAVAGAAVGVAGAAVGLAWWAHRHGVARPGPSRAPGPAARPDPSRTPVPAARPGPSRAAVPAAARGRRAG
jgi:HAD superfamily hydrolase (TIGR01490 family)